MIEHLLLNPHILHQTADNPDDMPEQPIAVCVDATGLLVVSQEGRSIVINRNSIPELCKLLRKLSKEPTA